MALSRLKALAASPAVRKFTDRDSARDAFAKSLSAYLDGEARFRVLTYYGVGGIGKTSLLGELGNTARAEARARGVELCVVRLDFDSDHLTSAAEAQYAFRMQWPGPCPLFEFALARYWVAQGRSLEQIQKQVIRQDSLLYDLLEASAGVADLFVPVKLVARLLSLGSDVAARYGHLRDEFERIATLPEADLAEYLPMLLGRSIEEWAQRSGSRLLVLVDGHERLFTDERYKLGKLRGDDWLRELIGAAESGLYVICGRNYVTWAETNGAWEPHLEQHVLGRLSDEDAAEFLRGIPVTEHDLRRAIVAEARGVPLYLDICASIYIIRKASGEPVRREDFSNVDGEVIERFMNCLDREQAHAVRALSALACFDQAIFASANRALNIGLPVSLFEEFCKASYVEFLGAGETVAKVHAIISERLRPQVSPHDRALLVHALLDDARTCAAQGQYRRVALLLRSLLPALAWPGLEREPARWSQFAMLCLDLADAGYVDEAMSLGTGLVGEDETTTVVGNMVQAHCLRRRGFLEEARNRYQALGLVRDAGGLLHDLQLRVRYHAAHVDHLLGDYRAAERRYREIFAAPSQGSGNDAARWLARRQGADILMLQGRFRAAQQAFVECAAEYPDDLLWQLECRRFQGHVLRFNWMPDAALELYDAVAESARSNAIVGMEGKALVNIAESCAWTDPARAIDAGTRAIEISDACNNPIESGKAWTAMALANLCLGKEMEAQRCIEHATRIQEEAGYRAGRMFVHGASACRFLVTGEKERASAELAAMQALCDQIGVYGHVTWFHRAVYADPGTPPAAEVADWLDGADIEAGIRFAAARLQGSATSGSVASTAALPDHP